MLTRTITMKQIPILLSIGLYFSTYVVALVHFLMNFEITIVQIVFSAY